MLFLQVVRPVALALMLASSVSLSLHAEQQLGPLSVRAKTVTPAPTDTQAVRQERARGALLAACRYLGHTKPDDDVSGLLAVTSLLVPFADVTKLDVTDTSTDVSFAGVADGSGAWAVGACADIMTRQVTELLKDGKPTEGHRELVELDFTLSRLSKWLRKWEDAEASKTAQRKQIPALTLTALALAQDRLLLRRQETADLMRKHDLLNPFSAAFLAGSAIGGSGRLIGDWGDTTVRNRISEREATLQYTRLTVESAHFGWQGEHTVDGSVRAYAGYQPALTILRAKTESAKEAATVGVLQQALVVSAGGRMGFPIQRNSSEVSVVANFGAARPTTDAVTFDDKQPPLVATAVKEGTTITSMFTELGAEYAMFDNPVRVLHAEKGLVTPALVMAAGYRYDSRFNPSNFSNLDSLTVSPHRVYARFMVDAVKTVSPREVAGAPKTFDIGFGLEYERNMRGSSMVPSTTRFFIRGSLNLLKAAAGDQEKAKDEKPTDAKSDPKSAGKADAAGKTAADGKTTTVTTVTTTTTTTTEPPAKEDKPAGQAPGAH